MTPKVPRGRCPAPSGLGIRPAGPCPHRLRQGQHARCPQGPRGEPHQRSAPHRPPPRI